MNIRELIEAVERGDGYYMCRVSNYAATFPDINVADDARRAYTGDMNAALALMQAVLPGVPVCLHDMSQDYLGALGWVAKVNWPHTVWQPTFSASGSFAYEGRADTPARALLLAILKAKEGETP